MRVRLSREWWIEAIKREGGLSVGAAKPIVFPTAGRQKKNVAKTRKRSRMVKSVRRSAPKQAS